MISDFDLDVIVPIRKQKRNVNSIYRINYFKNCFHISLILTLNKKCFTTELNIREERVVFIYFYLCTHTHIYIYMSFSSLKPHNLNSIVCWYFCSILSQSMIDYFVECFLSTSLNNCKKMNGRH